MSVTGGIMAAVGLAGSIGGAAISSSAAGNAASTQANAATEAAQIQANEADKALQFQEQEWSTQQQNLAPWLKAGTGALGNLQAILAEPGQGWNQTFTPPTAAEAAQYPGYQFELQQGENAIQNQEAAKGQAFGGNAGEALTNYAENAAQTDYGNVYNEAFQRYLQNYGQYNNQLNRLAALSGTGQQAGTTLGQEGQAAASNAGNIDINLGAQQGQDVQNAAAATASGYVGSANAWSGAFGNSTNNIMNLLLMQQLFGGNGVAGGIPAAQTIDPYATGQALTGIYAPPPAP